MTETSVSDDKHDSSRADRAGDAAGPPGFDEGRAAIQNRWLLLVVGGVTLLAGLFAIFMPFVASLAATFTVGWVLIVSGVAGLLAAFRRHSRRDMAAAFVLALASLVAGVLMLVQPVVGLLALSTLIIAWFAASGALRLYFGFQTWGQGGGWMVAVGALSLALAILLFLGQPFSATWIPGVLLGVDLTLWGAVLLAAGIRAGRAPADSQTAA